MAIGLPASYEIEVDLTGGRSAARDAVESTFQLLGWEFDLIDDQSYIAKVGLSGASWGETLTVSLVEEGVLRIRSACAFQVIDWGKNRRNVDQFLGIFSPREVRYSRSLIARDGAYSEGTGVSPVSRLFEDDSDVD